MSCENKFNKICFCCLTEEGQLKNMRDELNLSAPGNVQFIECYTVCSGIPPDDNFNQQICNTCEQKLKSSFEFRELCRATYQTLMQHAELIPGLFVDVKHEIPSDHEPTTPLKSDVKSPSKAPKDVEASDLESEFVCFHCDTVIKTHREYLKHYERHKRGNSYPKIQRTCDLCGEDTKRYTKHIQEQHKDYKPFKCKYCVKAYQTPSELKAHLVKHVSDGRHIHKCLACDTIFRGQQTLRDHIFYHKNPDNRYFCPICGYQFTQFSILNEHYLDEHPKAKTKFMYPCWQCKKIYFIRKKFEEHVCALQTEAIQTKSDISCERCSTTFANEDGLFCHQFLGCGEQPETHHCETCDKTTFLTKQLLNSHNNKVHTPKLKAFVCEICGYSVAEEYKYLMHKASHDNDRKFKCDHPGCSSAFNTSRYLRVHCKIKHKEKKFECNLCKKRFQAYGSVRRHMSIHSDSSELRKFACDLCSERFVDSVAQARHLAKMHLGEMNFKCKSCSEKFASLGSANTHHRRIHEGVYWQCKHCEVIYKNAKQLKDHMFVHRGFKPFRCTACPSQYTDKVLFRSHLLNQHQIVFKEILHGYVEKEDLSALVRECKRKNYADLNLPVKVVTSKRKRKLKQGLSTEFTYAEALETQYGNVGSYLNVN